ncbi:hypothetical protein PHSY_000689 [Pseudozyma hubeiensis SY62]|uniref:Uncharacterized protein n=1 Tax=Pseudozyma hubeiensis (strain SY62) TaxID=1305764 RepID=R9NX70_PSEHS|nr:hypothetical protein PHSY_000689 [Pseudozyma hubeiensis SY62]GAC93127.1 hypothetical protein PHSY_000689 [Pseudozyma hubeiensis SY62]
MDGWNRLRPSRAGNFFHRNRAKSIFQIGTNRNRHRAEVSRNRNQRALPARAAQIGGRLGFRAKSIDPFRRRNTGFPTKKFSNLKRSHKPQRRRPAEREQRKDEPKAAAIGLLRANPASRE